MNTDPQTSKAHMIDDPAHRAWLSDHRASLLDFYQPQVVLDGAGYAYLDNVGNPLPELGSQLWLGARMLHCFSIASSMGWPGAREVAEHGLHFYVRGDGRDARHGGWFATVGGDSPSDRKDLYGQAHVLLAASSASFAGLAGAEDLLAQALEVLDRYWVEADGRSVESFDRSFTDVDDYRGQNANMHLTEAYLAAYEFTGNDLLLRRATRIAGHIAGRAADTAEGAWRLPEHFDCTWEPLPDHNKHDPRHAFRPYGSQPGHWLEWSKLLLQLQGMGVDEPWMARAARNLFHGAYQDAWADNGGFCYTVDWDGSPVVKEKFFWEIAEAIGAATYLYRTTREEQYADRYAELWEYANAHVVDHEHRSWFPELSSGNQPAMHTWVGKADLYHAYQATFYAELRVEKGIGSWAANN